MYKSLVFGDEFLAQGLYLQSLGLGFMQTSQVLPHWLNPSEYELLPICQHDVFNNLKYKKKWYGHFRGCVRL